MRLTINKNERNKLLKELAMADVLAAHGYRVHLVEEDSRTGSYVALINGIPADFKRTKSHNNIRKYASVAVKKQHAKILVYQFDRDTPAIHLEITYLIQRGYSILYFYRQKTRIIHSSKNKTAPETGLSIWYDCRHQPGDIPYFIKLMQR